jgi:DNA-binding NarL/FixJ family response regulator
VQRVLLADNQMMFRTGVARVLAQEPGMEVVAQCADALRLRQTLSVFRDVTVVLPSSLEESLLELIETINGSGCRSVLILEHNADVEATVLQRANGVVSRSISGAALVDTLYRVGCGEHVVHKEETRAEPLEDRVGERVLERLTPKEVQIVALVTEGWKNREIADRLNTKEQVVKNYLRSIYDKTGVSDRLELALFTIHHRALADATNHAWDLMEKKLA